MIDEVLVGRTYKLVDKSAWYECNVDRGEELDVLDEIVDTCFTESGEVTIDKAEDSIGYRDGWPIIELNVGEGKYFKLVETNEQRLITAILRYDDHRTTKAMFEMIDLAKEIRDGNT